MSNYKLIRFKNLFHKLFSSYIFHFINNLYLILPTYVPATKQGLKSSAQLISCTADVCSAHLMQPAATPTARRMFAA
jgi:hypothetical protein